MPPIAFPQFPNPSRFSARLKALAPKPETRAEVPQVSVEGTTATLRLYDAIDDWGEWWGISAREFVEALDGLPDEVDTIDLRVNSPGGIVFDGIAIINSLRAHKARVVVTVEGLAASMAAFVALSADELVMMPNTELMIHDAWALAVGDPADHREMADWLDRVSNNLAAICVEKAGGSLEEWRTVMTAETWFSAEEAVNAGLADRVESASMENDDDDAPPAAAQFDASLFRYAGRAEAPDPKIPTNTVDPREGDEDQRRRARQLALLGLT